VLYGKRAKHKCQAPNVRLLVWRHLKLVHEIAHEGNKTGATVEDTLCHKQGDVQRRF